VIVYTYIHVRVRVYACVRGDDRRELQCIRELQLEFVYIYVGRWVGGDDSRGVYESVCVYLCGWVGGWVGTRIHTHTGSRSRTRALSQDVQKTATDCNRLQQTALFLHTYDGAHAS